ncbi:MAG: 3-deoxy-8-phosphooctulonate synthase [Bacteroidia bacterium]|nr:3-deoxy-8-phosphooctulonate synthase [Bacteroidia bacterium]MCZ2276649.1 3-deoxy-8-phosphooctulonate synthase [Bacteroidia bacterium]
MIPHLQNTYSNNFFLIAGPCVVESHELVMETASVIKDICSKLTIPFIFKSSYRKANRSRIDSYTGMGNQKALEILAEVRQKLSVQTLTDIHSPDEAAFAADYVDVLQIPAFLCRQTEILQAAAATGKCVNIKKGQFLSADSTRFIVEKMRMAGNDNIMLTERGTTFGYHDLIVDFRSIPIMQKNKVPVVLDVTHSLQQPNTTSGVTGGMPGLIDVIASAGVAAGTDGVFIETHPDPSKALSDGANMLKLDKLEALLHKLIHIRKAILLPS